VGLSGVRGDSYAWGDYNNDGYQDLLVKGSRLFRNNGPPAWDFTEVTELAGLDSSGYAVWGDYNNDGYLDFYSAGHPYNFIDTLWRNNGPPSWTFTNVTAEAGNPDDGYPSIAAGWGDYDRDGYIDVYVVNWRDAADVRYPDKLWHNDGDGTFSDVTISAGIDDYTEPYAGMGVNWGDYNNDGWLDIYVSNYLLTPNFLWHNNGDGTFVNRAFETGTTGEESRRAGQYYYGHTAGSSWADFDNDGDLDLWQTNLAHKDVARAGICADTELLRNDGAASGYSFTNVRDQTGIPTQPPGGNEELFFGVAWGDYDNDGDLDVWVPQIKNYIDYAYSYFFRNNGDGTFTDVSNETGVKVWDSDGGSWCDYNNDGWLDLITEGKVPYENGIYEVRLYRSNGASEVGVGERNWLRVSLEGRAGNTAAIGARVSVTDGTGRTQLRELEGGTAGHSYQHSLEAEFGFGTYNGPVDITVRWPTGKTQAMTDVGLNKEITIIEEDTVTDMVVAHLWSANPKPVEGTTTTLYAKIENWGTSNVDSCRVRFFAPEKIGSDQIIDSTIAPGGDVVVSVLWDTSGKLGENSVSAEVDSVIPAELNNANNKKSKIITVVKTNSEPRAVLTASPTTLYLPKGTVTFDATGSTDDGEITGYYFDFGDNDISDWVETPVVTHTYRSPGEYTASLVVRDDSDTFSSEQAYVTITVIGEGGSTPPVIHSISIEPEPAYAGKIADIYVEASDPEGDIISYSYNIDVGTISGTGHHVQWQAPPAPGDYNLEVVVADSGGNKDTMDHIVSVIPLPAALMQNIQLHAYIEPAVLHADGREPALITAEIKWKSQTLDSEQVERVYADLSELGGKSRTVLRDDGSAGDITASDGLYSVEFIAGRYSPSGTIVLDVNAELTDGRIISSAVSFEVVPEREDEDKSAFERLNLPGFEGGFVIVSFLVAVVLASRMPRKKS
jgi:hypothetical protein